ACAGARGPGPSWSGWVSCRGKVTRAGGTAREASNRTMLLTRIAPTDGPDRRFRVARRQPRPGGEPGRARRLAVDRALAGARRGCLRRVRATARRRRTSVDGAGGRAAGGGRPDAGGLLQGVPRPGSLSRRGAAPGVARGDRRQRGEEPVSRAGPVPSDLRARAGGRSVAGSRGRPGWTRRERPRRRVPALRRGDSEEASCRVPDAGRAARPGGMEL